jgi:hypothetical protein
VSDHADTIRAAETRARTWLNPERVERSGRQFDQEGFAALGRFHREANATATALASDVLALAARCDALENALRAAPTPETTHPSIYQRWYDGSRGAALAATDTTRRGAEQERLDQLARDLAAAYALEPEEAKRRINSIFPPGERQEM